MASRKVDGQPGDAEDSASVPDQFSQSHPDDITEEPQLDMLNASGKSQKPGRFRRTALTFFGVRKSICILPSFFGGRIKNQNKGSSKKGIIKSKTHDGLSKVSHDDDLKSGYTRAGDLEYLSQRDSAGELHSKCHDECSHHTTDQKSRTLTGQKKGLRGLFHSLKYHRNHRNVGSDKTETIAMTSPDFNKEVPVVQDNTNQYVTECLGSEPDVPDVANATCNISMGPECIDADAIALETHVKHESPKSELDDYICDDQMEEMKLVAIVSTDYEESSQGYKMPRLELQTISEPVLKSETPAGSTDQLNLILGDVASLKSFDSLTGCGDIIADQEDDSITESTVSGERSRNGGKRSSCYLTYQGGGEEMASPEDLDEECLHDFWGNNVSEEICQTCNQDLSDLTADLTSSLQNSNSAHQASEMDTSSIADVLTPQSEHKESVPNSDEGYYDSTTPGPDDGQEKTVRLRTDRLPRDSYSGDALYELFAPDESLISPHYESKSKLSGSNQCEYLSERVDMTDSAFAPDMSRLPKSAELYKVRDFAERPCSKSPELAQNVVGRLEMGTNKNFNLNLKSHISANRNNTESDQFEVKENLASTENQIKSTNVDCEQIHRNISFGRTSDPDFEDFCEPKEQHLEENKPVALPYRNINPQSTDCSSDLDDGQVSFSQALVDYTKHSQMLSNLQNNVDLETNSAFTPNMQALPTIVTFDVVDMHNEGEYDQQIHMELEEDISSPYQEFEGSYLQKNAFTERDYHMLDLYEQSLISNAWAAASLPRHLGLTRASLSMSNPLSLDRRSRSLDTESLELKMPDTYRENRAAIISCSQAEKNSGRDFISYYKKNVLVSASEVRDSSGIMASSWQTRSDMTLSLPLPDHEEIAEKVQGHSQTHVKRTIFPNSSSSDFSNVKSQRLSSKSPDRVSRDLLPLNAELCRRQCHLPLQSDSSSPHSAFVFPGMMEEVSGDINEDRFCKAFANLQSYNPSGRSRPVASRDGISHPAAPPQADASKEVTRTPRDVAACNKPSEATFD